MEKNSTLYTVVFAAVVCLVCGVAVASSAVGLRERQDLNKMIDKKSKVLAAAALLPEGEIVPATVLRLYDDHVVPKLVFLKTGEEVTGESAADFDFQKAMKDPAQSSVAPENKAKVARLPEKAVLYEIQKDGETTSLVLPVEGKGLWSTLYGFLALSKDTHTVQGLIFYQHGETPGLGGEVDNPRWLAFWPGRKAFDENHQPALEVLKGPAGTVEMAPHHVDGLSGATITSRGVTHLLSFWLGDDGFGPTLAKYREHAK